MLTREILDEGTKLFKEIVVVRKMPVRFASWVTWDWALERTGTTLWADIVLERAMGRTLYN